MSIVIRCAAYFSLFFILQSSPVLVQAANAENQTEISLATVREKIITIKNKPNIEESLRLSILQAYYASEDDLEGHLVIEETVEKFQKQLKTLPVEIKRLEKRIAKVENQLKNKKKERFSLYPTDELEQRLIIEKSNFNELKSSIRQLEIQLDDLLKRPQQIREQIAEINNEHSNNQQEQTSLTSLYPNKLEFDAHQTQWDSRFRLMDEMLTKLDLEQIVYPLKVEKTKLQQQLLNLQSKKLTALIEDIDDFLIERKQEEIESAQASLIQAEKEAEGKNPIIQSVTRENIRLNQLMQETNRKLDQNIKLKVKVESQRRQLEKDFQSAEQKINLAGLSPILGNLLRDQRRSLPEQKNYESTFKKIQQEISLTSLNLFQIEEAEKDLSDMDAAVLSMMEQALSVNVNKKEHLQIRTELRLLLNDQKDLVFELSSVYSGYSRMLADVDFSLQQLIILGEKYSQYLDERLLWVPSAPIIDKHYVLDIFNAMLWFSNRSHWQQAAFDMQSSMQGSPILSFMGLVLILWQLNFRKTIKRYLQELLENSSKPYADRFNYTFYALGYAFLLELPWALLVALFGSLLLINKEVANFSQSIANGLLGIIIPLLIIQFFYRLFKPRGIVQSLFYWQEDSVCLMYGQLKWIRFLVIPALFIIGLFADGANSEHSYSLGRMALISIMLAVSFMFHRLAHPIMGLAKYFYQINPIHWVCRFRYVWYGILVLIPLIIIGFAIAGYYQSALELQHKFVIMLRLTFFTVLLHEVIMRWMALKNRKLALQNARQKRQQMENAKEKEVGVTVLSIDEELLDIPKINEQSQKLLMAFSVAIFLVGSWLNLRDILPALSIFDQVVLWQHSSQIGAEQILQPITLINVFVCLLYLVLMLIFVNNFSGFLDLLFVGRYFMAAGSRYALVQLTRYAVISITVVAVASELGGSWSQVQWLVAAVSVGLGFGLQEIFANMVSGIILLFERPIRVGDTVTVGDVTGTVCKIEMRATTITDWDQKELIVPNKMFITDKLVNWTLTDTTLRVVVSVGISYDSDEVLAQDILKQIVADTPKILKQPEPTVYFLGFGESSLDFSIRAYVRDLDDRLPVIDELHNKIRRAFKENNIEIPFPQRDLHIRSSVLSNGVT